MKTIVTLTPIGAFQSRSSAISRVGLAMRRYRGLPYLNEEASSALSFLESEQDGFRRKTVEDFQTQEIDGKVTKEAEILKAIGFNPKKASLKRMVKEITYA